MAWTDESTLSVLIDMCPSLLAMTLKRSVHVTSDFNTGTVSQATLQITESKAETFFATCSSRFVLAVTIKEVEAHASHFFFYFL